MRQPSELWVCTGMALALMASCDQRSSQAPPPPKPPAVAQQGPSAPAAQSDGPGQQQRFLARIRQASAGNGVIRDARLNQNNELGVVLDTQVKLDQVRPLMTTLLKEMRDEFPGRPLTVIAYAPNGQPMATMRYDPSAPADANVTYKSNF